MYDDSSPKSPSPEESALFSTLLTDFLQQSERQNSAARYDPSQDPFLAALANLNDASPSASPNECPDTPPASPGV